MLIYWSLPKINLKTNAIQQLTKNDTLAVVFPYTLEQELTMNTKGYQNLAQHPFNYQDPV
jgi:alcohol dehydrogenase YqhD (iron-dependent ADH family)